MLVIERGGKQPRELENWDAEAVSGQLRYRTRETWLDGANKRYRPGQYYFVGGHTKFFGTAMFRFREADFGEVRHDEGVSPAWPISYSDLEPCYDLAESLFGIRGDIGGDPTHESEATGATCEQDEGKTASLRISFGGVPPIW